MKEGKHGMKMTSYEEAVMDLMIKVVESERYLEKYKKGDAAVTVMEDSENESYPAFSVHGKDKGSLVQKAVQPAYKEHPFMKLASLPSYEATSVRLTLWEWLEARKRGIGTILLLLIAIFLHIYITWTAMNKLSVLILNGMKYGCILLLALKFFRYVKSGEIYNYLNEE